MVDKSYQCLNSKFVWDYFYHFEGALIWTPWTQCYDTDFRDGGHILNMLMEVGLTLNIKSAMKRQENLDLQSLFSMEKYPSEKFSSEVNPRRTEINKMISKP